MADERSYRALDEVEIRELEKNECEAEDWSRVLVAEGFRPDRVHSAYFGGDVRLGVFEGILNAASGVTSHSGIYHAALYNCTVDDDVRIANVDRYVANYDIERGALIENVGLLVVDGETAFGHDVRAKVMIESGLRDIPVFEGMTSQIGYVLAFCRDRADAVRALETLAAKRADAVSGKRGSIGPGARIVDSQRILNVNIGAAAHITGALSLGNGTVGSISNHPCRVGSGVIAKDFIFSPASCIESGSHVERCFVGRGVHITQQFIAEDSVFFANCDLQRGEALSVFAGPFTQSHHKASLLLTAQYSFYNAGSGTNFSNHLYKLGPVHQGVLERGCKTGSGAYLVWPSHVGPFTTIIGRHKTQMDTSAFPFSYLFEGKDGRSLLLPGSNLFTIGLYRDNLKWPERDRRPGGDQEADLYRSDVLSPYSVGRMIRARNLLAELDTHTPLDQDGVEWKGAFLPRERIRRGWQEYNVAISLYLGEKVALCLETVLQLAGRDDVEKRLLSTKSWGLGDWCDFAGMLLPDARIARLLDRLAEGDFDDLRALESALKEQHDDYAQMEWNWVLTTWLDEIDKPREEIGLPDIVETLHAWRDALHLREERLLADAAKEFAPEMQYGYGVGGSGDSAAEADFAAVRGSLERDPAVIKLRDQTQKSIARADRLLGELA